MRKIWLVLSITIFLSLFDVLGVVFIKQFPTKYSEYVEASSIEFNVNKEIIYSIMKAESGFDKDCVSKAGAVGLMQVMPETADWVKQKLGDDSFDLTDPKTNIRYGTYYFSYLFNKFNDLVTALAAYNAGEGNVINWMGENLKLDKSQIRFSETKTYVDKVLFFIKAYKILL
ncbi:MAG: lytic transglycosylase domain-containing protein [Clostridia bacterium]|nr:lytic transglycosylase domain-containing protein [Clostridia bacterium]